MGSSHSYVSDPNAFATEFKGNEDRESWEAYDYVIVGGGTWCSWLTDYVTHIRTACQCKELLVQCLHPVSQKIQTLRSC
jgi:hypothetical protein